MDSKRFWIILAVILVGFFGFIMFNKDKTSDSSGSVSAQGSSNYYGNEDSPVTVTEFVDFQCEACYAYYPYVKEVKEKYKDKVRFQVRNFPITSGHQFAMQAARAAEAAARQGKFWEMHDKIFEGQKTWERGGADTYFKQYAEDIGLDMAKLDTDVQDQMTTATINADLKLAKELGVNATPTFFLNGKKVEQPENSVEAFSKLLDNALSEAGSGDTQN